MKKNKSKIFICGFLLLVIISVLVLMSKSINYWTYIQYNDTLYVLNMDTPESNVSNPKLVGTVEKKLPSLITPSKNNTSNGAKKGTEIYTCNDDENYILVKHNEEYYSLVNIDCPGWGNGVMGRLK